MTKDCIYLTLASLMFIFGIFTIPVAPTEEGIVLAISVTTMGLLGIIAAIFALEGE